MNTSQPPFGEIADRVFNSSCESMVELPDESVNCIVTSPPYWGQRDYGHPGQIGLEATVNEYVERLVTVFREARRVLRRDGTLWLNLGDAYAGAWGAQSRGNTTGEPTSTLEGTSMLSARQIAAAPKATGTGSLKKTPGLKPKDLIGIPWRVAFALQADGWWLRSDIVWHKPNPMPLSVTDRCTSAHEYVFMLTKSKRYYYDADAIREPLAESSIERLSQDVESQEGSTRANAGGKTNGNMKAVGPSKGSSFTRGKTAVNGLGRVSEKERADEFIGANKRDVWTIATGGYDRAHFAVMPRALAEPCILAGCPAGGIVLDPFMGSGTVAEVALGNGRHFVGYELNPEYCNLIRERLGLFGEGVA